MRSFPIMQLVAIRHDICQPPRSGSVCVFRAGTSDAFALLSWWRFMKRDSRLSWTGLRSKRLRGRARRTAITLKVETSLLRNGQVEGT